MNSSRLRLRSLRRPWPLLLFASLLGILVGGPTRQLRASDLSFRAGLGYDYLSQQFYSDSIAFAGPDSSQIAISKSSTYLNDLAGCLSFAYAPQIHPGQEIRADYKQTRDLFRSRLSGRNRWHLGNRRLDLTGELEVRKRFHGESEIGDSFQQALARARLTSPIGSGWSIVTQLRADGVNYDSDNVYAYDYYRLGGSLGVEKLFESLSSATAAVYFTSRQVPDSSELERFDIGLESSYLGLHDHNTLDLAGRIEFKNYRQPAGKDDHLRLELRGDNKLELNDKFFSRQGLELDVTDYRAESSVNFDFWRLETVLLFGTAWGRLSLALGPELELYGGQQTDALAGIGDYTEWGLRTEAEYFGAHAAFMSVQSSLGRRKLAVTSSYESSYWFERFAIMGNIKFARHLILQLLWSSEWDWHELQENDTRVTLLSTFLMWEF